MQAKCGIKSARMYVAATACVFHGERRQNEPEIRANFAAAVAAAANVRGQETRVEWSLCYD